MVKPHISNQAMHKIHELLNSDLSCEEVDCQICAIVGEWAYYEDYKKVGQLKFLK